MEEDKIILVQPGFWDGSVYKNGEEVLVFTSLRTISFKEFLDDVHKIVQADRRICDYVLHYLIRTEDYGMVKSIIMSDRDLQRVARIFKTPKIYVSVKPKHHGTDVAFYGSQSFNQPGVSDKRQDNLVHLMSSQGAYGNPFAYGGQTPVGYNFTPDYRMNNMHYPVPYLPAPYIHGAGPSSAPYLPALYIPGVGPSSTPIVDQLGPSSAPVINQPRPNSAPVVNQPRPSSAPVVKKPRPASAPVVNKPRPSSTPIVNQPRPSSTPVVEQPRIPKRALEVHDLFAKIHKHRTNGIEDNADGTDDDDDEDDEESSC